MIKYGAIKLVKEVLEKQRSAAEVQRLGDGALFNITKDGNNHTPTKQASKQNQQRETIKVKCHDKIQVS